MDNFSNFTGLVTFVFYYFQSRECEEKKIRTRRDDQADQTEWTRWDAKEWAVKIVRMRVADFKCCAAEHQNSLRRKSGHQSQEWHGRNQTVRES